MPENDVFMECSCPWLDMGGGGDAISGLTSMTRRGGLPITGHARPSLPSLAEGEGEETVGLAESRSR